MTDQELMEAAERARNGAYAPYSKFTVGAALLTKSGKLYTGCNIENASFSATVCAERTAIFRAVGDGETQFEAIAIVGGKEVLLPRCVPCGVCRQVMAEFCGGGFRVLLGTPENYKTYTLDGLLPLAFRMETDET